MNPIMNYINYTYSNHVKMHVLEYIPWFLFGTIYLAIIGISICLVSPFSSVYYTYKIILDYREKIFNGGGLMCAKKFSNCCKQVSSTSAENTENESKEGVLMAYFGGSCLFFPFSILLIIFIGIVCYISIAVLTVAFVPVIVVFGLWNIYITGLIQFIILAITCQLSEGLMFHERFPIMFKKLMEDHNIEEVSI